ncbi:MAG: hypothetical protein AAFU79_16330, partial [Myxococcota bacterium]
ARELAELLEHRLGEGHELDPVLGLKRRHRFTVSKGVLVEQFRELSSEVLAKEAERSPLAKKIYDSFSNFQARSREFQQVSEKAYLEAR